MVSVLLFLLSKLKLLNLLWRIAGKLNEKEDVLVQGPYYLCKKSSCCTSENFFLNQTKVSVRL